MFNLLATPSIFLYSRLTNTQIFKPLDQKIKLAKRPIEWKGFIALKCLIYGYCITVLMICGHLQMG